MDKSKIAVDIFDKYAAEYQEKFMDVTKYSTSLDLFCDQIRPHNAEVLDVACGPGNVTHYLLQKRPDFKLLGIDLSPKMIALAEQNNPLASFQLMDARRITELGKRYDAVMCAFCLPYLSRGEAEQFIQDAAKILRPKGVLFLSTMEDDYNKSGLRKGSQGDEIFMHFHEAGYLLEELEANGFEVIDLNRQPYQQGAEAMTDLLIVARL